jgi:TPR repeat protein
MRRISVFWVFTTLFVFVAVIRDGYAQDGEAQRLGLRLPDGSEKTVPLRPKAEKGEARAQFDLGFLYLFGDFYSHLQADQAKGMYWLRKSLAQGDAQAQDLMGCLLHRGQFLAQDKVEAARLFRKAAEQGDPYAQSNLGYCYLKGEGVAKDVAEAVGWFRLAAAKGEVRAQFHLGCILETGEGFPKDCSEAAKWFFNLALIAEMDKPGPWPYDYPHSGRSPRQAEERPASAWRKDAEAGNHRAQYELGYCYEKGVGVAHDEVEAFKWYRKSAQGGYAPAQFALGYFHQERSGPDDHDEILKWYGKAADQGYAKAQFNLGRYYDRGQSQSGRFVPGGATVWTTVGIPSNPDEALKWYRKAAENGHAQAQYLMGKSYHSGKEVPEDHVQAVKWWRKAAEQGHPESQFNLGVMCLQGHGTDKDYVESAKWFRECAMQKKNYFRCRHGMPTSRPMVDGIQTALMPLRTIPKVR